MQQKFKIPTQRLDLDAVEFRKLAFTAINEAWVRSVIFAAWQKYFVVRRQRSLRRLQRLEVDSPKWRKLRRTKFVRLKRPRDLAGACKITAQVAYVVFPLAGQIISNRHHTFVVLSNGEIYDMNRQCRDVRNLFRKGRALYRVDPEYSDSRIARSGRESWHDLIGEILLELNRQLAKRPATSYAMPGRTINKLPAWARPIYIQQNTDGEGQELAA